MAARSPHLQMDMGCGAENHYMCLKQVYSSVAVTAERCGNRCFWWLLRRQCWVTFRPARAGAGVPGELLPQRRGVQRVPDAARIAGLRAALGRHRRLRAPDGGLQAVMRSATQRRPSSAWSKLHMHTPTLSRYIALCIRLHCRQVPCLQPASVRLKTDQVRCAHG